MLLYIVLRILLLYLIFKPTSRKGKVIPGPGGLPFVGSAFDVTPTNMHIKLYGYAEKYGDIVGLKLFGQNVVALNAADMIRKALCEEPYEKYFSDRAEMFFPKYLFYGNQSVGSYTDGLDNTYNDLRKGLVKSMHVYGDGIKQFEKTVVSEIERFMTNIDKLNGEEFEFTEKLKPLLSNIIAILLSGESPLSDEDDDINIFWEFVHSSNYILNPKRNGLLLAFPFLRHLPGAYRQPYFKLVRAKDRIARRYFHKIKETHTPGKIRGIIDFLIDEQAQAVQSGREVLYSDERIICVALEIVLAGILTSVSTISSLLLCLLNHTEYQTKIQRELVHVIGRNRLPTLDDRLNLPFFEAVALELQRYITIGPVSGPRLCRPNTAFEGYDVKKTTLTLPNLFFLHHNDKTWGDPWIFRPELFLNEQGQLLPRSHPFRKNWMAFGTGRRQCSGETLARSRIFLIVTVLLRRWNFVPSTDKCGSCDPRSGEFEVEIAFGPKPFYCKVMQREN